MLAIWWRSHASPIRIPSVQKSARVREALTTKRQAHPLYSDSGNEVPEMTVYEDFKPINVKYDESWSGRVLFAIRCLVDLQVRTVYAFLKQTVPAMQGKVLDVGCGES